MVNSAYLRTAARRWFALRVFCFGSLPAPVTDTTFARVCDAACVPAVPPCAYSLQPLARYVRRSGMARRLPPLPFIFPRHATAAGARGYVSPSATLQRTARAYFPITYGVPRSPGNAAGATYARAAWLHVRDASRRLAYLTAHCGAAFRFAFLRFAIAAVLNTPFITFCRA